MGLRTVEPRISAGSRSGVNWTLEKSMLRQWARVLARVVFPTPGTSSRRTCPALRIPIRTNSMLLLFVEMTRLIDVSMALICSLTIWLSTMCFASHEWL